MVLTDAVFHAARFWLKAVAIVIWRPRVTHGSPRQSSKN
jgi:hypothetical protein